MCKCMVWALPQAITMAMGAAIYTLQLIRTAFYFVIWETASFKMSPNKLGWPTKASIPAQPGSIMMAMGALICSLRVTLIGGQSEMSFIRWTASIKPIAVHALTRRVLVICIAMLVPRLPQWAVRDLLMSLNKTGIGQQPSPLFGGKLFPLEGNALGVAVFDWNNDGHLDIAVANDMTPNHLLENNGKGKFQEIGRKAGMALTQQGLVRAGMGIDTADIHHSGDESVLIGNFAEEMLGLWENRGGVLVDTAFQGPIGIASYRFLTFGLAFADFDNDSWPDFITANGHINDDVTLSNPNITYRQRPQIFLQRQNRFLEVGEMIGPGAQQQVVGRGLACADYDLDGDVDVVISANGGVPLLLRNESSARFPQFTGRNHTLRLKLKGKAPNTDAIGALIKARIGGETLHRWVRSGSSYLSQSELPITLGNRPSHRSRSTGYSVAQSKNNKADQPKS